MIGGVAANAVSGSTPVPAGSYLFTAKIQNELASCTGALVDPSWVITTTGCFPEATQANSGRAPDRPTTVTVGRTDLTGSGGHVLAVTALVPHATRDVVLAQLAQPVTTVAPVALGSVALGGEQLVAAGFGRTATEWVPTRLHAGTFTVQNVTAGSVAIDGAATGATLCRGDAGGPLLREVAGTPTLVALHGSSWQGGCLAETETRRTAIEVRVDDLGDWIHASTADDYVALPASGTLLDTRTDTGGAKGLKAGGSTTTFRVLGTAGVPAYGVSAVLVDVAAISPTATTHLTAFPGGTPQPATSTVNAHKGDIISATQVVRVGADGTLSVYTNSGDTHIMVDVHGYFRAGSVEASPAGGGFVAVPHRRVADTRDGTGTTKGTVPSGGTRTIALTGGTIPVGATGALLDIAVVGATGPGYLRAYPTGGPVETRSLLDYVSGITSQGVAVKLSANGQVTIENRGPAVHLVISVQGYVTATARTGAGLRLTPPTRVLNTTADQGVAVPANGTVAVQLSGANGIPSAGLAGAIVNLAVVKPTGTGFLAVKPDSGAAFVSGDPSVLNFTAGQHARASMVVVQGGKFDPVRRVGQDGRILIKNVSGGTIHLLVDLHGWFGPARIG